MPNTYESGTMVRLYTAKPFTDIVSGSIDPANVFIEYTPPGGATVTLQYGVSFSVQRTATGTYYVDIQADMPGTWIYRWYATGQGRASDERYFFVHANLQS